jgi:NAD(P)-dependent dehydrogenase (short-subunit alcohol dehydrogenase family)
MHGPGSAVVAGGTGGIGEGIVKTLLGLGWTVCVPVLGAEKGQRLRSYVGDQGDRLHLVPADLTLPAEVAAFRKLVLQTSPPLDLVVVSVGSSYYGHSLHKIAQTDWDRLLEENLATHFHLQHEFLGYFHEANRGFYVTLAGPEADFVHPETGLMSVFAGAQKMMARVEALEAAGTGVRVYSVTSKTPIATRARGEQSASSWITPLDLADYILALVREQVAGCRDSLHVLDSREQLRSLLEGGVGKRSPLP